jgi:hypothetical protein
MFFLTLFSMTELNLKKKWIILSKKVLSIITLVYQDKLFSPPKKKEPKITYVVR